MENENVDIDTQNNDGELDAENTNNNLDENQENDLEKKNKQLFERTKKAEAEAKELKAKLAEISKKGDNPPKNEQMSLKDIRALQDVPDEDIDEVIDFAKYKGVSIAEAKNNPVIKTLLKTKMEERAPNQAANTKKSVRGASGVSEDDLIAKVKNSEDMTDEEMKQAAKAIIAQKKAQNKRN